jgi:hypothetical protein
MQKCRTAIAWKEFRAMRWLWSWHPLVLVCCFAMPTVPAPASPVAAPRQSANPTAPAADVARLAARIDLLIAARWAERSVKPASASSDAEFLRRVSLDLTGRIPRVADVRAFLSDRSADKRRRLVERLLATPNFVTHFSDIWRAVLLSQVDPQQAQSVAPDLEIWLRPRIRANQPFDQLVRDLLIGSRSPNASVPLEVNPVTNPFYQGNEFKAENLAANTSRIFLGVRLECAQCHDHPFSRWKRTQFWEYAAFFAGVQPRRGPGGFAPGQEPLVNPRTINIPGTDKYVEARFLSGPAPRWKAGVESRVTLAAWITALDNPYFARATVNRLWAHFFGIGLIDPVDDEPNEANPISHPELLAELTREFIAHNYDLKFLIRAIAASRTYQLTSTLSDPTQEEPRSFARMAVRGLTAEQLFASLAEATGFRDSNTATGPGGFRRLSVRAEFLARFASQDRPTEAHTSILQALSLMNGRLIADTTSLEHSTTLAAVADAPFLDTAGRIETLFLATLARPPRSEEVSRLTAYVNGGGPRNDPKAALADVFWALLNSSEFILNH